MNHFCPVEPRQIVYRRKALTVSKTILVVHQCRDVENKREMEKVMLTFYIDQLIILDV